MTITDAIKKVMVETGSAMTVTEVYQAIVTGNLYEFHSDNPKQIIRTQIRRHCEGLDFPSANPSKHFKIVDENKYWINTDATRATLEKTIIPPKRSFSELPEQPATTLRELLILHERYIAHLKKKILADLKRLSPPAFESFSKQLLDAYGFHDTKVTQVSGDGGIDGHGKLKVGLANLNVAFQCKRWTKGAVQRPEVDRFRGAIQGHYEQGLFFTTTTFSKGSIDVCIRAGAVPIILIDGEAIVNMMFEKGLGVQTETLSIPSYALDIILSKG